MLFVTHPAIFKIQMRTESNKKEENPTLTESHLLIGLIRT